MSRGNRKSVVFDDTRDCERFLELLKETYERHELCSFSYALINNHYHAVIHTPRGNLAQGMKHVNGGFTQWSNRRHRRTGHVFEGRYVAILVQDLSYLRNLVRYIALNPVKAGLVAHPKDWQWSSYSATAGLCECPPFLKLDWLEHAFGTQNRREAQSKYCAFVDSDDSDNVDFSAPRFGAGMFQGMPLVYPIASRPPLSQLFNKRRWGNRNRNLTIVRAHRSFGYGVVEIANHLGLHHSTVAKVLRDLSD